MGKRLGIVAAVCLYFYYVGGWFGEHLYLFGSRQVDFPASFMLGVLLALAFTILSFYGFAFFYLISTGIWELIKWVRNG